jgi:tetratricopeptide (TPR) repeat protein
MGACYDDLGESALAIKHFKRELELDPVSGCALYNLGSLYHRTHKYKLAAEIIWNGAIHKSIPSKPSSVNWLGVTSKQASLRKSKPCMKNTCKQIQTTPGP